MPQSTYVSHRSHNVCIRKVALRSDIKCSTDGEELKKKNDLPNCNKVDLPAGLTVQSYFVVYI